MIIELGYSNMGQLRLDNISVCESVMLHPFHIFCLFKRRLMIFLSFRQTVMCGMERTVWETVI